jgi:hypothetical protein
LVLLPSEFYPELGAVPVSRSGFKEVLRKCGKLCGGYAYTLRAADWVTATVIVLIKY